MRGEGNKKEVKVAKKFEEMTVEEKQEAFEKWMEGRTARRGQSTARRAATQQLIKAHQDEYNKLLKSVGGKSKRV